MGVIILSFLIPFAVLSVLLRDAEPEQTTEYHHPMSLPVIPKTHRREGITPKVRYQVLDRDGGKCRLCGSSELLEVDHIVPVARGGSNDINNLQTLCRVCNRGKGVLSWK